MQEPPAWGKASPCPCLGATSPPNTAAALPAPHREAGIVSVPCSRAAFDFDPSRCAPTARPLGVVQCLDATWGLIGVSPVTAHTAAARVFFLPPPWHQFGHAWRSIPTHALCARLSTPGHPLTMSVLFQQSYGEGPHYGEHRDLPAHNSISSSPFLGPGLVGKCLLLPRRCGINLGGSNREWFVLTGSVCTAQRSCFPHQTRSRRGYRSCG